MRLFGSDFTARVLAASIAGTPLLLGGCGDTSARPAAPSVTLAAAIVSGDDHAVRDHIIAGTDLNAPNETGDSPLSLACVFGRHYAAEVLIDAGVDLETTNSSGATPLFNAAFFCRTEIVDLLIDAGADVTVTDQNGTPIGTIMSMPWEEIEPIYAGIYGAIGLPFDAERIRAARPGVAERLR